MTYPVACDTIRRIQNEDGMCLDVRPWPESPDVIALMNSNESSREYFGNIEISMSPEFARELGLALLKCADEIKFKEQPHFTHLRY